MKLNLFFCFFLFFLSKNLSAQSVRSKLLIRDTSLNPIPFSTIRIFRKKTQPMGTLQITDSTGIFEGNIINHDTLVISNIGFQEKRIIIKDDINNQIIYLHKKIEELTEIFIGNFETMNIGTKFKSQQRSFCGDESLNSYEMVTLMRVGDLVKKYRLKKIYLNQKKYAINNTIKVHLYTVNSFGLPQNEILSKQIILEPNMYKNGRVIIDLKDQNLVFKNQNFFIGIQFVKPYNYVVPEKINDGIGETTKDSDTLTFRRTNQYDNRWFVEFNNGLFIPKQGLYKEKSLLEPSSSKKNYPINMIANAEIEIIEK